MKPPQRRRAAPARYLGEVIGSAAWSPREKRQLLRLLQARRGQPEPDAADLAKELPDRSEAEVRGASREGSEAGGGAKTRGGVWAGRARGQGQGDLDQKAGCGWGIPEAEGPRVAGAMLRKVEGRGELLVGWSRGPRRGGPDGWRGGTGRE